MAKENNKNQTKQQEQQRQLHRNGQTDQHDAGKEFTQDLQDYLPPPSPWRNPTERPKFTERHFFYYTRSL